MKLKDIKDIYKCDKCGACFPAKQIKLKPWAKRITILQSILVIARDGTARWTNAPIESDKTLHCPLCDRVHLFGFDLADGPKAGIIWSNCTPAELRAKGLNV
jgi:hypothetical protein